MPNTRPREATPDWSNTHTHGIDFTYTRPTLVNTSLIFLFLCQWRDQCGFDTKLEQFVAAIVSAKAGCHPELFR